MTSPGQAGVSDQTVSRLLSGFEGIRPETRARVERALRELDYRPNFAARSLTKGRTTDRRIDARDRQDRSEPHHPGRLDRGASGGGYVLDIVTLDMADESAIAESLELIRQQDLGGVLVLASTDEMIGAFRKSRFRVPVHLSTDGEGRVEPTGGRTLRSPRSSSRRPALAARSPKVRAYRRSGEFSGCAEPRGCLRTRARPSGCPVARHGPRRLVSGGGLSRGASSAEGCDGRHRCERPDGARGAARAA